MRCPTCDHIEDRVVDSRLSRGGRAIRRRRECIACGQRFTTYELVEKEPLTVRKTSGAIEAYGAALEIDPTKANYHAELGRTLVMLGRHEEAIKIGRDALELNPDFHEVRYELVQEFLEMNRPDEAIAEARRVLTHSIN